MNVARNAAEVLAEHTTLELECVGRMYLNIICAGAADGRGGGALLPRGARQSGAVVGADGADDAGLPAFHRTLRGSGRDGPGPVVRPFVADPSRPSRVAKNLVRVDAKKLAVRRDLDIVQALLHAELKVVYRDLPPSSEILADRCLCQTQ